MNESMRRGDLFGAVLVAAATAVTIVVNALGATGHIHSITTAQVSARFPTVLTPAGFTFTIWILIYLGLIAFSIYQLMPSQLERFRGIRALYLATCLLNCGWIFFWHRMSVDVCFVLIAVLAVALVAILVKLKPGDTMIDAVLSKGVFGLYAGWVVMASLVNVLIMLKFLLVPWTDDVFTWIGIVFLLGAAGAAVVARFWLKNYLFAFAVAWGATGVAVQQSRNAPVIVTSVIVVIVGLVAALSFVMEMKSREV